MFKFKRDIDDLKFRVGMLESKARKDHCPHEKVIFTSEQLHFKYEALLWGVKLCLECGEILDRYATEMDYQAAWLKYMEEVVKAKRAEVKKLSSM